MTKYNGPGSEAEEQMSPDEWEEADNPMTQPEPLSDTMLAALIQFPSDSEDVRRALIELQECRAAEAKDRQGWDCAKLLFDSVKFNQADLHTTVGAAMRAIEAVARDAGVSLD